jgi:hypothetical protein
MADTFNDPYAAAGTDEERQAIYARLQAQYDRDLAEWEQKEFARRRTIYDDQMVIWDHQRSIQKNIDERSHKSILTLAAGSFGVSFAFISQIVKIETAVNMPVLVLAWALFALAIVLSILELKIGSVIQDFLLDIAEKNIQRGYEGKTYIMSKRWLVMWPTRILGWVSVISFILGVICLLYFVLMNTIPA